MFAAKNHEASKTKAEKPSAQVNAKGGTAERVQVNPLWNQLATRIHPKPPVSTPAEEGRPLEAEIRHPMERFFQHPLDQVRVFSGPDSHNAAESLGAFAFTFGQNIHLGAKGQALPVNRRKALLAHEATHTLQQHHAPTAPQLSTMKPDSQGSRQEQQADGLSRAFMLHEAGYPGAGLAIRDSINLRAASHVMVQMARYPTNFGEFEDYKFNEIKDTAGTSLGVQLYLKFHPGGNVDAKKIGLTQAAEGKLGGSQINTGYYGRRQATSGAGVGYFIDRQEGNPSPLYGTAAAVTPKADPTSLGAYAAPGIRTLTTDESAKLKLKFTGIDYGGGSVFGYRYKDGATLKGPVPAEMHDATLASATNSSEQVFETAALAIEGAMAGTYLGSVEWGWRRDATGTFSPVPVAKKSMGVPSVNFLTAASIWNTAREHYALQADMDPTTILNRDGTNAFTVSKGSLLQPTQRATAGGKIYYQVNILDASGKATGQSGVVLSTDTTELDYGRETVDLPVPEIHTVNSATGTVLNGETRCSNTDPVLPQATRVRVLGPFGKLAAYVRVEVADGPLTGRRGVVSIIDLTRETLGTH